MRHIDAQGDIRSGHGKQEEPARVSFSLYYAGRILATVEPDLKWPGMWRISWSGGPLSDLRRTMIGRGQGTPLMRIPTSELRPMLGARP